MSKKFQLKNGLKVLLLESHKSPVVSVQMWVKTGSIHEKKGEEGLSHFIEHLVFKGTEKFKVGEIASIVEGSGGELNAYTSFDQTVFYVTISKQFTQVALDVVSQMMGFPTFDEQEIDNEREVVIEEIKRGQDSPQRQASQMLFANVFKKSPYGRPVIGYDKVIRQVTSKKIKNYFNSRYVPRNMFLVVSGDFKSAEMKKQIQETFSRFVDYKLQKVAVAKEPAQTKVRIKVEQSKFEQTLGYLSWRMPGVESKDLAALEVLSLILGQGDSSRLSKALRINEPLTNGVGTFAYAMQTEGVFAVSMNLQKENLQKALTTLTQEIQNIISIAPSAEELQKAVTILSSQEIYSLETVDNIARKAGSDEFYYNDSDHFKKHLKNIYNLKPEDILKVAKKYLNDKTLSLSFLCNQDVKLTDAELKLFVKNFKKMLTQQKKAKVTAAKYKVRKIAIPARKNLTAPVLEKIVLKSGATLLIREQKETPTISVRAAFLGGVRIEPDGLEGLVEMFSGNWVAGSKKYSEEQINLLSDQMAAGISSFGGRNSVGLTMECLKPFEEKMYDIFEDILLHPTFPAELLEREKTVLYNQIKSRNDNPSQICMLQFMQQIYKGHPYAKDMLGTEESVKKIKRSDLIDYYNQFALAGNLTICVVGDVDKKEWVQRLEELSKKLKVGSRLTQNFAAPEIKKDQTIKYNLKKEQAHIVVGYQGLKLSDPERHTLEIIQSILSGQGGRLFLELRDKNSLAYSVAPIHMEGIECGYVGGYIGCSPEKTEKAIEMLKAEFLKLTQSPIGKDELLRAQRYLVGRHDIELQRKSSICNSLIFDEIYGLDPHQSLDVAEKYFAITEQDVQKLAKKLFLQKSVISVVGPE